MALPSAFRARLEQMELTRNQRLSILQAEKELQFNKSILLQRKLSTLRSMQQRCLKLELKIASQRFIISSLKSEIDHVESCYLINLQHHRDLKIELEELEELAKKNEMFYHSNSCEMEEFRAQVGNFIVECRRQVEDLRSHASELKSNFAVLQQSNGQFSNSGITAAELKKSELLAAKEDLDKRLYLNYQRREQLQKQLQIILQRQDEER